MRRAFNRIMTVVSLVAMLAATSFAAPMCSLCAPSAPHHDAVQPTQSAHDHCGAAQTKSPEAASITRSQCAGNNFSCVTSSKLEKPALPLALSIHSLFVPAAQATESSPARSDSLRVFRSPDLNPTPLLLTTTLRV